MLQAIDLILHNQILNLLQQNSCPQDNGTQSERNSKNWMERLALRPAFLICFLDSEKECENVCEQIYT